MTPPDSAATNGGASEADRLAREAEELDGYFSDAPLDPQPNYPPLSESMDSAVIITHLPKVSQAKIDKLTKVVTKLVTRLGTVVTYDGFEGMVMPYDRATDSTLGFCLVEYETPAMAQNAVDVLQDYKFDKNHSLTVTLYSRAQELANIETLEFVDPSPPPFVQPPSTTAWLEDDHQRDEYLVRFGTEMETYWWDGTTQPVLDYDGDREKEKGVQWCEYYAHWSPLGSYLATLLPLRGVIVWSGATYEKCGRFAAPGVKAIVFSPRENYLLTNNHDAREPAAIKVYQVATQKLLRTFALFPDGMTSDGAAPPPPFLWSHDDAYLARMGHGLVSVYETPSLKLLDQRSVACPGIADLSWSPRANVLAYWAPEQDNIPAHVDLLQLPARHKLRQKNLFNVSRCHLVWHPHGDYLAVKVTRHTKSKKTLYNNIELFRLNLPGVPVEMLDIKDAVLALVFEPRGSRFAMIHAETPTASKVQVSFYDMTKKQEVVGVVGAAAHNSKKSGGKKYDLVPELHVVDTLSNKQCNSVYWSPAGSHVILASLGDTASGTLEFYDVDNKTLVIKEHYRANQVVWDPAGRSVASVVSQPIEGGSFKFAMDNGYILWSFQGKQLYQQSYETFYQFLWRPRETLLAGKDIANVKRNLAKYQRQFEKADKLRQRRKYLEETQGKRTERAKIRDIVTRNRAMARKQRTEHIVLLRGYDSDDDAHYVTRELTVETVLSSKDEVVA